MHLQLDPQLCICQNATPSAVLTDFLYLSLSQCVTSESFLKPCMWMNGHCLSSEAKYKLIYRILATYWSVLIWCLQDRAACPLCCKRCDSEAGAVTRGLRWSGSLRQITPSHCSSLDLCPNSKLFWQVSVIESYFVLSVVTRPFIFRAKSFCC